jgi:hypothetical protein
LLKEDVTSIYVAKRAKEKKILNGESGYILLMVQQLEGIVSIKARWGIYTQAVDDPIGFAESRRIIVHI